MKINCTLLGAAIVALAGCYTHQTPETVSTSQPLTHFGPWSAPVNVGAPLNTEFNDSYAVVMRNGLTVYFTSDRPGKGGDDLWVSHRATTADPWGTPENLAILNSTAGDSLAVFSTDEKIMYFASTRPGGCGLSDLWTSRLSKEAGWSVPQNLGCVVNTAANENAPAFYAGKHHETILYFGSNRPGGLGDFDIYQTKSTDKYLADASFGAGVLVPELSSPKRDTRTFVRKDGLEIFITSDRDGGNGLIDIWVATRAHVDDVWSTPVNLGAIVNSDKDDGSPALSRDGTTLHFFSNRAGGLGLRDIYMTQRVRTDADDQDEDDGDNSDNDDE